MTRCVVIPSYKAAKTLRGVIETLPQEIAESGLAIMVNDGSPDDTGAVADALAAEFPWAIAVHHPQNRGYGGALKTGMREGLRRGGEVFPVVHSDGQYAPDMAVELCGPIERGEAQIVQGSRMLGGARAGGAPMPLSRYLPNKILTTIENAAFGTRMAEFHSGYMVYSKRLLEEVPFQKLQDNYNFDAEMIILAHRAGYPCAELPIPTKYDDETSSLDPIPYGINVLKMVGRELFRGHYRKLVSEHHRAQVFGPGA